MLNHAISALAAFWRVLVLCLVFALGAYLQSTGLLAAMIQLWPDVVFQARQHLELVFVSGGLAILAGVPIGILLTRPFARGWGTVVLQLVNIGSTIPTLAKLALAMSILGIGTPPAIFGLFVLSLLPIVTNTAAGLRTVPHHLIEAARGMGMTPFQLLIHVELPNALYVIFAGIRTALAINVGTAPLAFLIGGGGLGDLIFTGINLMEPSMLLAGSLATAALAVLVDFAVGQCQFWLVSPGVNPLRDTRLATAQQVAA